MRAPVSYDRESGSITFFADIPKGATVQITEAVGEDLLNASLGQGTIFTLQLSLEA